MHAFRFVRVRRHWICSSVVAAALILVACKPSSLIDVQSPSTVVDPSQVKTPTGATQLRNTAIATMMSSMGQGWNSVIVMSGTLTDELQDPYYIGRTGDDRNVLGTTGTDNRNAQGFGYGGFQNTRVVIRQALQALQQYVPDGTSGVPRAWQGELYALQGYTVTWLAELYCSGIPLSQSSLNGAQIPTRGLHTDELFNAAIALFDSAMVVGADSAQYVNLARVGKARALLNLGQFAAADSVIQNVPLDFVYFVRSNVSGNYGFDLATGDVPNGAQRVQDREGGNGLVWSTDPRTAVVTVPGLSGSMLWPSKYNIDPSTGQPDPTTPRYGVPVRLADGLEARLIQAEAALARGDASWLTTLNMLRATCVGTAACAPRFGITSAQLPPLNDPGAATRLDTLMKERAMWLYLTGHREGDLRRMAHVYNRNPNTLWPTGIMSEPAYPDLFPHIGTENGVRYGTDVVYGPDVNERARNPLYGGCYDTNP